MFTRSRAEAVSLPPMGRISNLVDVIFKGAEPGLSRRAESILLVLAPRNEGVGG